MNLIYANGCLLLRWRHRRLVRRGFGRFDLELRHAELPLELVELVEIYRANDVHDRKFARFCRNDCEPERLVARNGDVDVDIRLFLATAYLDESAPPWP